MLHDFAESLRSSTAISPAANKLHLISRALYGVACFYFSKLVSEEQRDNSPFNDLDHWQAEAGEAFTSLGNNPMDVGEDLGALLYAEMDECFFGPQQVLGSLQLPFPTDPS